ncbi:MAG: phosphatidylglycerol lysyltransferase domain-containing protein [Roseobacter sp.]
MPLVMAAICLHAAPQFIETVSYQEVFGLTGTLSFWAWFAAICMVGVSFYAVGQYDILARREIGMTAPEARTRKNGMIAIALSQALGFGLATGSLARYRLRPDEGMLRAGQMTALVTFFFLTGMFFVTLLAILASGVLVNRAIVVAVLFLLFVSLMWLALRRPEVRFLNRQLPIPSLLPLVVSIFWAGVDILAAATAFYILLPESIEPSFLMFLPVFCIALAAGIVSGVPGGVGPFEVVLLSLTAPHTATYIDQTCLLTTVLGFRIVYFVLPALIATFFVVRSGTKVAATKIVTPCFPSRYAPRAETGVITQNGGRMVELSSAVCALWPVGNSLVSLFDPVVPAKPDWIDDFRRHAHSHNLLPILYKCSARHAVAARKKGWYVFNVANDAILKPIQFEPSGSKYAGLRRKLRKADKAGVTVRQLRLDHMPDLEKIDLEWQARCGGARGGAMGRFCPAYLADQLVLVAEVDAKPIAFISLHQGQEEWALDLMRDNAAAPDGTMYLLVLEAIKIAADRQVSQLSLAAVPSAASQHQGIKYRALNFARDKWSARGLKQFKSAFSPEWKPLYMAAPGRVRLCIGAIDLLREIMIPSQSRQPSDSTTMTDASASRHSQEST